MTSPHDQQPDPQRGSGDHNRAISTGDIVGNTGPVAVGWNIIQKILHVELPIDDKSRQSLIKQVREFWVDGVLVKSLYREAWSALGLYADPQAITYAGQLASVKGEREPQPLPANVTIDRVFDDAHQRLLILGAPGSGKTTLLLELAQTLLERAAQDKEQAIPVVFNLSSWAQQRLPLDRWLVQELCTNYSVGKNLARQWVRQRAILPLLDGLDEVAEPQRAACVKAINDYCAEHGPEGIVVCSRIADYRAIGAKLVLHEAVVLQPLSTTQIATYLDRAGTPLAGVRTVLAQDAELMQLVRVPLMLNIVSLAYQGERPEELRGIEPAEQRRRLFERYVERMLERPRKPEQITASPRYTPEQTNHWLRWLAARLHENNQTVFQMELMQPWWLGRWWQRGLYVLLSTVFAGMIGLLLGPLFGLLTSLGQRAPIYRHSWHAPIAGLLAVAFMSLPAGAIAISNNSLFVFMFFLWAISSIPVGLAIAELVQHGEIRPAETLRWSWHAARSRWDTGCFVGMITWFGFIMTSMITVIEHESVQMSFWLGYQISRATCFSVAISLVIMFFIALSSASVQRESSPNQKIWRSLLFALFFGWPLGLVLGTIVFGVFLLGGPTATQLAFGLLMGLVITGPTISLYFGGLAFVQHWVLRLLCALCGYAPWRYARFLDYAAERILLRRVGGSYIFVHRMLLEYFASVEIAEPQPATSNPAIPTNDNLTSKQLPDIDTLNNIAPELPSLTQLTNETEQPLIRDNSGQVAVGSNIAQASGSGSAHVDSSRSVFDQRGQHVGGSQYNAARDMNIGREHQEPRRPNLSDRRLAQAVQAALERHGLDEVLFNLGSYAEFMVNIDTLGADVAAQARNLVTLCRSNKQRSALVASLRDFEDGLLGSPEEEDAWLAWAQELDER